MERRNQAPLVDSSACLCRVERSFAGAAAAARLMPRAKACVQPSLRASIHPLRPKSSPASDRSGGGGQRLLIPGIPDDLAAAWRSLEDEAGVQEVAPAARRQLHLRPPPPAWARRAVAVRRQVRRRGARVVGRAGPGAASVARSAALAGRLRRRRRRVRLRRARRLPPLQRPEQPVAPRAGHAPPPPRLRLLRRRQPPLRRRRRRRADVGRGVRPGQEPVVVRVRHGGAALAFAVGQRGARREVAREGDGPTSSGGAPRVLAGDRHVGVDVARAARRHGRRVEEPERVRRRRTLRRRLQGRMPAARLRRGRRRVERPRRRRRAARGELRRGGGRRHGRAPREALRRAERHERLRRRRRRRRGGETVVGKGQIKAFVANLISAIAAAAPRIAPSIARFSRSSNQKCSLKNSKKVIFFRVLCTMY